MIAIVAAMLLASESATAAEAQRAPFGTLADGTPIEAVTLSSRAGASVCIMTLGATVQSLRTPDRHGVAGDIVLGFDTAREYGGDSHYFGATVGRYANRIAKGRFTLDGHVYTLAANDHGNHLHGGLRGFNKVIWSIDSVRSGSAATAVFSYVSPDGEEGYPGRLHVTATYSLDDHNTLRLEYRATTDKPTVVNISTHSYFDLSAGTASGSALTDLVQIHASLFTPVDELLIPTGEVRSVEGTPFDFRHPTVVGLRVRDGHDLQLHYGRGYDHNFVLDGPSGELRPAVRVVDPVSGRTLEILTSAPGLQFYSGNFLDATTAGKNGRLYRQSDALAFEPQYFPDSPNHPNFPSARLDPGQEYRNAIEYRFGTEPAPAS